MQAKATDPTDFALERSIERLVHVAQLLTAAGDEQLYGLRGKVLELADELSAYQAQRLEECNDVR